MKSIIKLLLAMAPLSGMADEPEVPLVFKAENTFALYKKPSLPPADKLPIIRELPDPLKGVKKYKDWGKRRAEIAAQIQHYGIGRHW